MNSHLSRLNVTTKLKQPTRLPCEQHDYNSIWPCFRRGLPCHLCYHRRGALLPHPFTLTYISRRFTFCCTFRRLTPPRCYLAPCSMKPGLSSPNKLSATVWPTCKTQRFNFCLSEAISLSFKIFNLLNSAVSEASLFAFSFLISRISFSLSIRAFNASL